MATLPLPLLPPFDFSTASRLSVDARVQQCIATIQQLHAESDYLDLCELPPLPMSGASPEELSALEYALALTLPDDYRYLLSICRYVEIAPGACIYGLSYNGIYLSGPPYVLDDLAIPGTFLAIGDYWRFADGDQLLLALDDPDQPVVTYFHEDGPRIEYFAPSVSLALWRLTYEEM
jgi:hypothetical protein